MSKALLPILRENCFLIVLLSFFLLVPGCSKQEKRTPSVPPQDLLHKTIEGVTVTIQEQKPAKILREYKQLRVLIENITSEPLRLAGSNITLPLADHNTLKKHARGFKSAYHWQNAALFGTGLVFLWPLCLTAVATTGIGYQLSKVSDKRAIDKQAIHCLGHDDIIDIAPRSSREINLFIRASYLPTFAMTIWKADKPLVFLARPSLLAN